MRRLLMLVYAIALPLLSFGGNERVVERSANRRPEWVYGMESGYIITTAEGRSIAEARDKAMQQVKERIITAVAEHIASESSQRVSEVIYNGNIESAETYEKQIRSNSANIPFINDISEAYAKAFYWEKVSKGKKEYYYRYNVKYPFSSVQIRRAIREYEAHEAELDARTEAFRNTDFATFGSVEEMLRTIDDLRIFQQSLAEEDVRRAQCRAIGARYNTMLSHIQLQFDTVSRAYCTYYLWYIDHIVTYSAKPKTESNCLTEIQWSPTPYGGKVSYNYHAGCYDEESNSLNITYRINGQKTTNQTIIH